MEQPCLCVEQSGKCRKISTRTRPLHPAQRVSSIRTRNFRLHRLDDVESLCNARIIHRLLVRLEQTILPAQFLRNNLLCENEPTSYILRTEKLMLEHTKRDFISCQLPDHMAASINEENRHILLYAGKKSRYRSPCQRSDHNRGNHTDRHTGDEIAVPLDNEAAAIFPHRAP